MIHTAKIASVVVILACSFVVSRAHASDTKSFSLPGVIEFSYPASFVVLSAAENEAAMNYGKKLVNNASIPPDLAFDQVVVLHTAYTQNNGEYAHVAVTLMPPEATQEQLSAADAELIKTLRDTMGEQLKAGFAKSGITILGDFQGERERLSKEIQCFKLTYSYKKSDGSIRIDTKRYIYTNRHMLVVGITTSPGYFNNSKDELKKIISSIVVSNS